MPRYAMVPSYKNNARFLLASDSRCAVCVPISDANRSTSKLSAAGLPANRTPLRLQFQLRVHVLLVISSSATASTFRLWGHGLVASGQL